MPASLSVVIPCYNETATLEACVRRVREIASDDLQLEIVIVDDASTDDSLSIARSLSERYPEVRVIAHEVNQGKGAALRTGFQHVTRDYVAVQDADLEYDPKDLLTLLEPLEAGQADVVFGSRFLSAGAHRVLYFWHSMGNRFLTFMSNMFTDLNLTDMETCYKVFRREVIQSIEIEENRFGFEPEVVAKVATLRLRVYEKGISYHGRTYEEGKKIGARDGFRALYCILRYNARSAPLALQFFTYLAIGTVAAFANLVFFVALHTAGAALEVATPLSFGLAAVVNYLLCVSLLFQRNSRWRDSLEWTIYIGIVLMGAVIDFALTWGAVTYWHFSLVGAKTLATSVMPMINFAGRRFVVFPQAGRGPWRPIMEGSRARNLDEAPPKE